MTDPASENSAEQADQPPRPDINKTATSTERILNAEEITGKDRVVVRATQDATVILKKGSSDLIVCNQEGEEVTLPTSLDIANWQNVPLPLDPVNPKIVRTKADILGGQSN